MSRTGLLIALAVAVAAGLVFALYPKLDLIMVAPFYDPASGLWFATNPTGVRVRSVAAWAIALITMPAFFAFVAKLVLPARPMLIPGRAAILMIVTLALGPGLLANVILKDYWGRPRPMYLVEFDGMDAFVPWWDPRGGCPKNCSFIAGEPSGAFWTIAPATVVPPQWRALAYGAALAFGTGMGIIRMAGGGHFLSDVVFSGVFMFLLIWVVHGVLYRWRATRFTDAAVERIVAAIALARLWKRLPPGPVAPKDSTQP
jgi:membrane-associated PAP2 superfamily phosphatase